MSSLTDLLWYPSLLKDIICVITLKFIIRHIRHTFKVVLQLTGKTHTDKALELVRTQIFSPNNTNDREAARDVLVLITDGKVTEGREQLTIDSVR